jgi:hypothetical protein
MRPPCFSYICVSVNHGYTLMNAWINLHETWYVRHGTWVRLNVVLHKSFSSQIPACPSLLLSNGSVNTFPLQWVHVTRYDLCIVFCAVHDISKGRLSVCLYSPPTRSRFTMIFFGPAANAELVHKFHVVLHSSHAIFLMVTSTFYSNVALTTLDKMSL